MPTVIKLQNGDTVQTDEAPQALADRFNASRRDGTLIKVDADVPTWVNPHALMTISHREPSQGAAT